MSDPREIVPRSAARATGESGGRGIVLILTFFFVLAVVSCSTGFVVYTALHHEFADGLFALTFAVLSARAAISWFWWNSQPTGSQVDQPRRERLRSADEVYR